MSWLKRITATVSAQVDQTVSQIENHDAVIAAAIKETQRSAAQTKVRLSRVRADGQRMRSKLDKLRVEQDRWTQRARKIATDNREHALQCVARRNACHRQIEHLEAGLRKHDDLSSRLANEFEQVQARLQTITDQRNLMRTRESAAEAVRMLSSIDGTAGIDIEEALDRWEVRVTEAEMSVGHFDDPDQLDQQLSKAELREALDQELDQLIAEDDAHG